MKLTHILPIVISFFALTLGFNLPVQKQCLYTRSAFDIGSGSTRLKVAKVNTCTVKIIEVLREEKIKVPYKSDLSQSTNSTFSQDILAKGFDAFKKLMKISNSYHPDEVQAVATAAFRQSQNSDEFIEKVRSELGLNIQKISQTIEAKLGFVGAKVIANRDFEELLVWDIGGGSMQMISFKKPNSFNVYLGELAAVSFKNLVIEKIQNKNIHDTHSPNPMSLKDIQSALNEASIFATKNVPEVIKKKIKNKSQVIGIGGVHYYSLKNQIGSGDEYTYDQVLKTLKTRAGLTDAQLKNEFAATEVSNLALVAGFMKALNIEKVKTGNINLTDGLLIAPEISESH